jgi:hypothetical protein
MSDPAALFDQIVGERGGRDALSIVELAVCRQLAQALGSDSANASAIASLTALLPPVQQRPFERPALTDADLEKDDRPWDLKRLNDAELDELERLCAVAQGRASPVRNRRRDAALALVRQLDEVEHEGGVPSEEQINLLRGDLQALLVPIATLAQFVEPYAVAAPSDTARETRVDSAAPLSESQPVPARASNVVRMPPRDASWAG